MASSLIITLQLDQQSTELFNRLRKAHYPAHANMVEAHLTLFHRLPADEPLIGDTLAACVSQSSFTMQVNGLALFSNGVAYTLESTVLQSLHGLLQQQWQHLLIRRDQLPLRPHITIMNKVTAFKAQQLYEKLKEDFRPFEVRATGIGVWRYLKGPWKPGETYHFKAQQPGVVGS